LGVGQELVQAQVSVDRLTDQDASLVTMSDALVLDLQRLAMNSGTGLPELLLRTKAVAVKLGLPKPREWIEHEINGYPPKVELPSYRIIPSELRVQNPFHGWTAVLWEDSMEPLQKHFARSEIRHPIAEVEVQSQAKGPIHTSLLPAEIEVLLATGNHHIGRLASARVFSRASFVGILEGVRAKVLDWALALEKEGILGKSMTFDAMEKQNASGVEFSTNEVVARVLFLSANPDPKSPLAVEKEQNRIVKVRNGAKYQEKIRIEGLPDVDITELAKSLRLHNPMVVHFAGHGRRDGSLLMRDENGKNHAMQPKGLAKLLSIQRDTIRLVILNACYSDELAKHIISNIDCVIGMTDAVSDEVAILFAQTFYSTLFDGGSILESFETSSAVVQARYPDETDTPNLQVKKGIDASRIRVIG